jgi:hypothetical protein
VVSPSTEGNAKTLREIPRNTSNETEVTHVVLTLTRVLLLSVFPINVLYAFPYFPMRATCPANPILLYLVGLIILGEDCKLNIANIRHNVCSHEMLMYVGMKGQLPAS